MQLKYTYKPSGVCSTQIDLELENGVIVDVRFTGGCSGNAQGLSALAKGMDARELIGRLRGIRCGAKSTSCPEQLSFALEEALAGAN